MASRYITLSEKVLNATVLVTAFGYFVDIYDFFIYNVVRSPSLADLHLSGDALTKAGLVISNSQLAGILIGGYVWGVLADKFGRKSSLFASILTYSIATFLCGAVQDVNSYALARFLAGFGVAGELGTGLALISEKLTANRRGIGVTIFIVTGFVGVLAAATAAQFLPWREAYRLGGIIGLILLLTRVFILESDFYENIAARQIKRGGLKLLRTSGNLKKYIALIFMIAPATFLPQVVWTLSPELARAQGIMETAQANIILGISYGCVIFGDLLASFMSEVLRSRKKAILASYVVGLLLFLKYIFFPASNLTEFYMINGLLGLTFGVWVVGVALAAEQFGTNIRATVTTTVPNFARGLAIPMNLAFAALKPVTGSLMAVGFVGFCIFLMALWGWYIVDETYGKNLNYEE